MAERRRGEVPAAFYWTARWAMGVVFARAAVRRCQWSEGRFPPCAAAGGDLDDIDEESSDDSVVDLTEFEMKAERLESIDDDDLYNEMSQEEPRVLEWQF